LTWTVIVVPVALSRRSWIICAGALIVISGGASGITRSVWRAPRQRQTTDSVAVQRAHCSPGSSVSPLPSSILLLPPVPPVRHQVTTVCSGTCRSRGAEVDAATPV
jgi:hypothetical protein